MTNDPSTDPEWSNTCFISPDMEGRGRAPKNKNFQSTKTKKTKDMAKQAIGILETRGLACLVVGVDAMLKAANVELDGPVRQVGSGLCSAVVSGDVAAVKAAIDTGAETAGQAGKVVSAHVIARPDEAIDAVLPKKPAPARTRK